MNIVRFGRFSVDLDRGILLHAQQEVPLRRQCWDLLARLAGQGGQPISRQQLTQLLWPDTFVSPNTLHYLLWDLRRTLARFDSTGYIVKVPRRGYHLRVAGADAPPAFLPALAAASAAHGPPPVADDGVPPSLLHRDSELARLREILLVAMSGKRQVAFITGEAGIGKSLLVEHWISDLPPGWMLGRATCLPGLGVHEPYAPLLDVVEHLATSPPRIDTIRRHAPTWLVQLPGLLPADEMQALRQSLAGVGPARMVREGVRLFEAFAVEQPTIIVLEDLDWADAGTLRVIESIASRSEPAALMLLASLRSMDLAPEQSAGRALVHRLARKASVARLTLQPLTLAAVRQYVDDRFEHPPEAEAIAALLERTSGGNPLFVTALADYLVAEAVLVFRDRCWSLNPPEDGIEMELPESLRAMIGDQLDLLPSDDIAILEAASISGSEFTTAEVAAALERPSLEVDAHCARMAREGRFLVSAAAQGWPDGTVSSAYRFRHLLYQRAVYARVAPERRQCFHDRIGMRLARGYEGQTFEVTTRLTEHFEAAGNQREALRYQEMAAALAYRRFSPADALAHVARVIGTIQRLPPSADRDRHEAEQQIQYSHLAILAEGFSSKRTREGLDHAYRLVFQHDLPTLQFRARLACCFQRLMTGATAEAEELAAAIVATTEAGNPQLASAAYLYSSMVHTVNLPRALQHLELATRGLDHKEAWQPAVMDLRSSIAAHKAVLLSLAGQPAQAMAAAGEARTLARAHGGVVIVAGVGTFCACAAMLAGEAAHAREFAEEAFQCGEENDIGTYLDVARMALDWAVFAETGRGLQRFERAVARRGRSNEIWYQGLFEVYLAEALCRHGLLDRAQKWLDAAGRIDEPIARAELWRIQGEIYRQGGVTGTPAASDCLRKARSIARRQGASTFEQRADQALAALRSSEAHH